jgi:hypothetical protein
MSSGGMAAGRSCAGREAGGGIDLLCPLPVPVPARRAALAALPPALHEASAADNTFSYEQISEHSSQCKTDSIRSQ